MGQRGLRGYPMERDPSDPSRGRKRPHAASCGLLRPHAASGGTPRPREAALEEVDVTVVLNLGGVGIDELWRIHQRQVPLVSGCASNAATFWPAFNQYTAIHGVAYGAAGGKFVRLICTFFELIRGWLVAFFQPKAPQFSHGA